MTKVSLNKMTKILNTRSIEIPMKASLLKFFLSLTFYQIDQFRELLVTLETI